LFVEGRAGGAYQVHGRVRRIGGAAMLRYFQSLLVYQHVDAEYSAQTDTSTVRLEGVCRLAAVHCKPILKGGIILRFDVVIKC